MRKSIICFLLGGFFLLLFIALTVLLTVSEFKSLSEDFAVRGSMVASPGWIAELNRTVHENCSNPIWYTITEFLGMLPLFVAACFAGFGLGQWFKRKSLKQVDKDLFCLAGLYGAAAILYLVFEGFVVNYRPVLVDGALEASFPSSHTVLVCVIMLSAALQFRRRLSGTMQRWFGQGFCWILAILVTVGRLLSGVHWLTDIVGGIFISMALVLFYQGAVEALEERT